jgi:tetratricopeptide (TPR) repeat protein
MTTARIQRNPYIIGRPITEPELFFGRESLFQFINDNLMQSGRIILLYGQRRIGKSSVLSQIPQKVENDQFKFVIFDLQDKGQLSLSGVLHSLATEIIDYLELDEDGITPPSLGELETNSSIFSSQFLPELYQALGDKKLVLLLDEFDVLNNYDSDSALEHFFPYLKSLVNQHKKLFIIPVLGRQLGDMPKLLSLFRGAPHRQIGLLDQTSAKQLITEPAKGVLEYDSDAIQAILELSAGHPNFTQLLCFALFGRAREEDNWKVTRTDVEKIVDKAIELGEPALLWFREGLPIPEQVVFSAVAEVQRLEALGVNPTVREPLKLLEENGAVKTDPLREAGKRLVDWGFLRQVESSNLATVEVPTYEVTIELVRRWLLKNRDSLRKAILQLENLDVAANSKYAKATEIYEQGNVSEAIKLYEQVLEANPNHFSALLKLAEGYLENKEFSKAIEYYQRLYKVDPVHHQEGLVRTRLCYGEYLMQQKQFSLAQNQFSEVLRLEENNSAAEQQRQRAVDEIRRALKSPFVIGNVVPCEQFVGRKDELYIAFDQILNSSNMVFYGGGGIGKSSFLEYLAQPEIWLNIGLRDDEYLLVYINCKNIHPFIPSSFWREVLIRLKDVLIQLKEKLEKNAHDSTSIQSKIGKLDSLNSEIDMILKEVMVEKEHIKQILRQIKRQDKFLVLLLDDYDTALYPKDEDNYSEVEMLNFLREFRNLIEHDAGRRLSTIMTVSKPLSEFGSKSTYNDLPYTSHPLKPFNDTELLDLWNLVRDEKWKQREDLRKTVQQITGGYPALFQMACFHLYRTWQQRIPVSEKIASEFASNFEVNAEVLLRRIWQSLTNTERMLLRLIALENVGGKIEKRNYDLSGTQDSFKEKNSKLNSLEKRGLIKSTRIQNKTIYSFTALAMQKWVIDEILNNHEAEVAERERVFGLMNKGHVNQIKKAMQWVGENADIVKSVAGGIQELVKLILLV